jgi:hypothetical protein
MAMGRERYHLGFPAIHDPQALNMGLVLAQTERHLNRDWAHVPG